MALFAEDRRRLLADYAAGIPHVLSETVVADVDTPVSIFLKLAGSEPYACLLESVEGAEVKARYSIIGYAPDLILKTDDRKSERRERRGGIWTTAQLDGNPLDILRSVIAESRIDMPEALPSMSAGLIGYMGYVNVAEMEAIPLANPKSLDVPDTLFMRPTMMAVFDAVKHEINLVTPIRPKDGVSAEEALDAAQARLDEALSRLNAPLPHLPASAAQSEAPPVSNTPKDQYVQMVRKAQDYILAGDIFQVVIGQRFSQPFALPPFALYRALRRTNPSPYLYYLNFDDFSFVGSSPEILVGLQGDDVTIRPIAGTYPRGTTRAEDLALEATFREDQKELAEHLMLLDLGRNDVGRVAERGSVTVTDSFFIERYSHVMHMVSNVTGKLRSDLDAIDALSAGFPAGTLSGAPKVRAMEIIEELEVNSRGPFGGGVGYFSASGDMDTAIVLRTAIIKDGMMHVQAGAGVVADSVPETEQRECELKAQALFSAAEEARRIASSNRS